MIDTAPRDGESFSRLLEAMPRIAEAVNGFTSEESQRIALQALVRAIGLPDPAAGESPPIVPAPVDDHAENHDAGSTAQVVNGQPAPHRRRTRKPAAKKSWARVKDINFRPAGKASLREFATEKEPANFHEKNVVAVYYLEEFLAVTSITVGHVLAAYEECGWKSPSIPDTPPI